MITLGVCYSNGKLTDTEPAFPSAGSPGNHGICWGSPVFLLDLHCHLESVVLLTPHSSWGPGAQQGGTTCPRSCGQLQEEPSLGSSLLPRPTSGGEGLHRGVQHSSVEIKDLLGRCSATRVSILEKPLAWGRKRTRDSIETKIRQRQDLLGPFLPRTVPVRTRALCLAFETASCVPGSMIM